MSRSGYSDDCDDQWATIRWRGAVAASIKGKRGQALLIELAEALDAMPEKKLISRDLKNENGYCTLGVLGAKRGLPIETLSPENYDEVSEAFGVAAPLVQEIVYLNDEDCEGMTPEERWTQMRGWVHNKIKIPE